MFVEITQPNQDIMSILNTAIVPFQEIHTQPVTSKEYIHIQPASSCKKTQTHIVRAPRSFSPPLLVTSHLVVFLLLHVGFTVVVLTLIFPWRCSLEENFMLIEVAFGPELITLA
jgi:hypothetical protein